MKTRTCLAGTTAMRWTFTDSCPDGLAAQYRFFDFENGLRWPAVVTNTFQSSIDGQTVYQDLACIAGGQVCYGAEPNPSDGSVFWGVALEGTKACPACCALCGASNPQIQLICQQ
ncbi:MAG: hypothetical protein ABUS79_02070 [Pseudomonadota bacterium]